MKRRSFFVQLVIGVLIVAAVYFFFIRTQGRAPEREEQRGRRESQREGRKPEARGGEGGSGAAGQVVCETQYFADWTEPAMRGCTVRTRNGYPVPDGRCTPGGVNPSVNLNVMRDATWRTRTVRNCASSEAQKHVAYGWYAIQKPRVNSNENQVCELDHLVPLELGGADGLGNIWPQCGPDEVTLKQRYFKQKDHVENYLAEEVKAGRMPLAEAQRGIAKDWTQYLNDADLWCGRTGRC
ncbi:MAG TPA: hypothetical protein VGL22_05880 [Terracidiphilus sp.]